MIKSFRHRGLKRLFEREDRRRIRGDLIDTVENILFVLDEVPDIQALAIPRYRLHPLKGEFKGYWAVTVKANWGLGNNGTKTHAKG